METVPAYIDYSEIGLQQPRTKATFIFIRALVQKYYWNYAADGDPEVHFMCPSIFMAKHFPTIEAANIILDKIRDLPQFRNLDLEVWQCPK